jgi:hypothetical protein
MLDFLLAVLAAVRVFVLSRAEASLEVLALRQQVAVLKRKRPRPTLTWLDRFFWTTLQRFWPRWSDVLIIVKPETVVRWHRAGFASTGAGDPEIAGAGRGSPRKCETSSAGWRKRIRTGVRRGSTANS